MLWNKEALKVEVEGYDNEKTVNWSELARSYNVKNKDGEIANNGGQIVKEWLKSVGVDVNKFKRVHNSDESEHVRRKKRRGIGGEITMPTQVSPEKLREMAKEKIESGEYTIGQRIVPKKVR